ncbi:uncharacterized protein K452DRAFT_78396 [Aplosporella prunicola CBS 121167]|uniref:Uncharacterized protein n=1 Tax=Aplosporella prunicola CBS 121167 TaxID=1176127 RepID=A0A6A6B488_9PEZI|nr:uncharacterized protein K452DRAFT_78396 [Aplosporella prunicola CBS 121167]KAF2138942.1 hypothetical protein K452DRAFT_78396 [Aplosporella prunicola CBS 121167]
MPLPVPQLQQPTRNHQSPHRHHTTTAITTHSTPQHKTPAPLQPQPSYCIPGTHLRPQRTDTRRAPHHTHARIEFLAPSPAPHPAPARLQTTQRQQRQRPLRCHAMTRHHCTHPLGPWQ